MEIGLVKIGNKPVVLKFVAKDITIVEVDAIVNAANSYLKHGGGVAGAIVRRGGYIIQQQSDEYVSKYGPVEPGGVAVTGAGNLRMSYVIHTVGPIGDKKENDDIMRKCLNNILRKADELGIKTLAMPFIGTGIFGFPLDRFISITLEVISTYFENYFGPLELVLFCDIEEEKVRKLYSAFEKILM
ncbi:MAG: macro domain-containing protein [Fervidobacterium sp.]